jgi:hypothetical protein
MSEREEKIRRELEEIRRREKESAKYQEANEDKELIAEIEEAGRSQKTGAYNILFVSIIADIFTFIPLVGNIFAIFFSVIIWLMYFLNSENAAQRNIKKYLRKRGVRVLDLLLSQGAEIFGIGLGWLPFFTLAALINLALTKSENIEKLYDLIVKDR